MDLADNLVKIKTHTLSVEKMDKMMLLLYVRTLSHYLFIFLVTNT